MEQCGWEAANSQIELVLRYSMFSLAFLKSSVFTFILCSLACYAHCAYPGQQECYKCPYVHTVTRPVWLCNNCKLQQYNRRQLPEGILRQIWSPEQIYVIFITIKNRQKTEKLIDWVVILLGTKLVISETFPLDNILAWYVKQSSPIVACITTSA